MQKLYCYADETGQDTEGRMFLVSVAILEEEREKLRLVLRDIEEYSRKGIKKWTNARPKERELYIQRVFANPGLLGHMYFAKYEHSRSYIELTIMTIARAIHGEDLQKGYQVTVLVDGLKQTERHIFGAGLRKLGVPVRKVRGVRDQSDEFIRVTDAIAGFVRNEKTLELYKRAIRKGILKEV